MFLTLHLTENCNMDCAYCVRAKNPSDMSWEVMKAACDRIFADGKPAGFSFFGGEPLFRKEYIQYALQYGKEKSRETGIPFQSKMTTNGILLDEAFLEFAKEYGLDIALSFDGLEQDTCRNLIDGAGTFEIVSANAKKLLQVFPKAYGMMTIAPVAVKGFAESVRYLYNLGFRRITATIAYGKKVCWTDDSMEVLSQQFDQIAEFYVHCAEAGDSFFFSPFDSKIVDMIRQNDSGVRCHLGQRQLSVDVKGDLYPCTQFLGDTDYYVGNVFDGIDQARWTQMVSRAMNRPEPEDCQSCQLRSRCLHTCGCANRLETGEEDMVSPTQCTYEKMVIAKSDAVADQIMELGEEIFWKKYHVWH